MADASGGANTSGTSRLPIKLILPEQGTERRVKGGGGHPVAFRHVDAAYRMSLASQVSAAPDALLPQFSRAKAIPVRVQLLTKASAKSHRPEQLFSARTCPIVGAGRLGEIFVKATPQGLSELVFTIEHGSSDELLKEISCVESVEPITPSFRRGGLSAVDVLRDSPRSRNGFMTRVRLFSFGGDRDESALIAAFEDSCRQAGLPMYTAGYSSATPTYGVECRNADEVEILAKAVGVRSVSGMPLIRTAHPRELNPLPLPRLPTRVDVLGDVPVVVVVDSGVSDAVPALNSWVVGRESTVAPEYRNPAHGTFVAGLICWGNELNPLVPGIDANPCAVFDLQVIPNADPDVGDVDSLFEQEFLETLESALKQHANDYRVWNLSLGLSEVCSLDEFSAFGEELDNLQERYGVSFVISAGNYDVLPLLGYPRTGAEIETGRITIPADSVLGIAVGSVAHAECEGVGPRLNELAPYSRHGAGPNYVIKPDLVHYGGTCSLDASFRSGIRSISNAGTSENMGTSFAAPLVSRNLAQIYHQVTPTPSPVLARALLTHHARDPRTGGRVPDGEENYFGFGLPTPVPYSLECTPYTSTLVFEDSLRPGYYLEWDDFPYPASLTRNGRYFGEIWMTVAFAPARGSRWGSEYCETHIDAHFGVYHDKTSRTTGVVTSEFTGLVPPEHKNPGELYEAYQVAKLRKWAPVRTYHGDLAVVPTDVIVRGPVRSVSGRQCLHVDDEDCRT